MTDPIEKLDYCLAAVVEMLDGREQFNAAELLRNGDTRVVETGFDNWDGGITLWTIYLSIAPNQFARLGDERQYLESQINECLREVISQFSNDSYSVKITPQVAPKPEWRQTQGEVSREVRQNIFDGLKIESANWHGRLDEVEFLERLYDLQSLPSSDKRFKDAAGDIWQHRINNPMDWDDDWIYSDDRFELLKGKSDRFLRFLCEVVHPVVRPDRDEVAKLVKAFNDQLRRDGWELVEEELIAGRPRFTARRIGTAASRAASRAKSVADALDAGSMQKQIERLERAVETDPALAIGTAKELVESCCKTILMKIDGFSPNDLDLPQLTKAVATHLKLVPEGISQEAKGAETIRLILRNLAALTQYLAELRSLYGTGHGRDGKFRGLEPRHARLAVGAAVAFIDFLTETYEKRPPTKDGGVSLAKKR